MKHSPNMKFRTSFLHIFSLEQPEQALPVQLRLMWFDTGDGLNMGHTLLNNNISTHNSPFKRGPNIGRRHAVCLGLALSQTQALTAEF